MSEDGTKSDSPSMKPIAPDSRLAPSWQGRLAKRYRIFRLLRQDQPFIVAIAVAILLGGFVLMSLPKIWRTTPKDFPHGEIRVSIVDRIQAWSLQRAAKKAEIAGNEEEAFFAWRGALVNNLGDLDLHRGVLRFLGTASTVGSDQTVFALRSASWLGALGGTNASDLALMGLVLERQGRPRVALGWMASHPAAQSAELDRIRARCLLSGGDLAGFAREWEAHGEAWKADPIQSLYHDAWRAVTDDRTAGLEATVRLKETMKGNGEAALVAARLMAFAAAAKGQVDDVGAALDVLESKNSANASQHGLYWKLLAGSGRQEEARRRASEYKKAPRDPEIASRYWLALRDIGMRDEAIALLEESLTGFGSTPEVWRTYFDLLAEAGRWTDVLRVAVQARMLCGRQDPLFAELTFAEYRSAVGERRQTEVGRLAAELAGMRFTDLEGLIRVSAALRADERWSEAGKLMAAHETGYREQVAFWAEMFSVGLAGKDLEIVRKSVEELVRIEPRNTAWLNNRAALLLITGENPSEALQLTLEGMTRQPGSAALRINHALALLANGRAAEAERVLAVVSAGRLPKEALANYFLAVAEIHSALGRPDQAQEAAKRIEVSRLMKPQVERVGRILASRRRGSGAGLGQ